MWARETGLRNRAPVVRGERQQRAPLHLQAADNWQVKGTNPSIYAPDKDVFAWQQRPPGRPPHCLSARLAAVRLLSAGLGVVLLFCLSRSAVASLRTSKLLTGSFWTSEGESPPALTGRILPAERTCRGTDFAEQDSSVVGTSFSGSGNAQATGDACIRFADEHRVLVEPACGASLAAVYNKAEPLGGLRPIVVIVCGGAGVSLSLLDKWKKMLS